MFESPISAGAVKTATRPGVPMPWIGPIPSPGLARVCACPHEHARKMDNVQGQVLNRLIENLLFHSEEGALTASPSLAQVSVVIVFFMCSHFAKWCVFNRRCRVILLLLLPQKVSFELFLRAVPSHPLGLSTNLHLPYPVRNSMNMRFSFRNAGVPSPTKATSGDDAAFQGLADGFGLGMHVQFVVDLADVTANRIDAHLQPVGGALVTVAFG